MAARLSRRAISRYVATRLAAGDGDALSQLAAYLIETRRTREADLLVRDVESALQQLGIVVADVTTARSLTAELEKQLTQLITAATGASQVHVRTQLDESLIGGVHVQTPGAEYDASVRRQITKLQAMKV